MPKKVKDWRTPQGEFRDQSLPAKTQILTAEIIHLPRERRDFQAALSKTHGGLSDQAPPTLQKAFLDYLPSENNHSLNTEHLHFPNH